MRNGPRANVFGSCAHVHAWGSPLILRIGLDIKMGGGGGDLLIYLILFCSDKVTHKLLYA